MFWCIVVPRTTSSASIPTAAQFIRSGLESEWCTSGRYIVARLQKIPVAQRYNGAVS